MIIIVERNFDIFQHRPISLRLKGSSRCSKTFHCVPRLILKFFSQILELNITTKTHILSQPVYWLTPNEEVARIIKVIVGAGFQVGNKRFDLFVTCLVLFVTYQIVTQQVVSVTKMLYLSSPQEIDSITQLTQPEVEVLVDVTRTAPYNPHSPQVFRTQYLKSETLLNGLLSFEHHVLN